MDGRLRGGQAGGAGIVGSHHRGEDRHGDDDEQDGDGDLAPNGQVLPALEAQAGLGDLVECATVQHQTLLILGLTST